MADVATESGLSAMTVSYAYSQPGRLSETALARVADAAARLGYTGPHPGARALRRGRAGALGVVIGEHLTYAFDDPQATRFLSGVAAVCAQQNIAMTLVPVTGAADDGTRVNAAAVDGFVVWTLDENDPVIGVVVSTGLPAAIHGATNSTSLTRVGIDDRAAAGAIGDVAFAGARSPVVLSFPLDTRRQPGLHLGLELDTVAFPVTRERLRGFRDAWERQQRSWSEVRVAVCATNTAAAGATAVARLIGSGHRFDAVAAMSDELALATTSALSAAGRRVPGDVSVTGFDDTAEAAPAGLSTVRQDLYKQGALCARLALNPQAQSTSADWSVIERSSTAR